MDIKRGEPLSKTLNELRPSIEDDFQKAQAVVDPSPVWNPIRDKVAIFHAWLLDELLTSYGNVKPSQNLLEDFSHALLKMAGVVAAINVMTLNDEDAEEVRAAMMSGIQRKLAEAMKELVGELNDDPRLSSLLSGKLDKHDLN